MKFSIVTSTKDPASMNIRDSLLKILKFSSADKKYFGHLVLKHDLSEKSIELYTTSGDLIFFEEANSIDCDFFIFASKHVSKSEEKTLTAHFTGNFSEATFGGKDKDFSVSCPSLLKVCFKKMHQIANNSNYQVSLEATHHGPLTNKPSMFVEIGSLEEHWKDSKAGFVIAKSIIESIKMYTQPENSAICFGGTHYANNFNKIELNSNLNLSHICPKYNIKLLDKDILSKMIHKTQGKVDFALLDWKGLSSTDKKILMPLLKELNINIRKTQEFI